MATEAPPNSSSYILDPEPGSSEYEAPAEEGTSQEMEAERKLDRDREGGGLAGRTETWWDSRLGGHLSIPPC